jgi:hypothetical protein
MAALTALELYTITTCKSKNAVNSAILMNPTNYFAPNSLALLSPSTPTIFPITISENNLGAYNNLNPNLYNTDSVPNRNMPPLTYIKHNGQLTYQRTNGWFHKWSPMFSTILKIVPDTPDNLFCAIGICAAFAACNPQRGNVLSNLGGFPKSASSQLITDTPNAFKEVITLNLGTDIERGGRGYLSNEGLKQIEKIRSWKGAIFNWRNSNGQGHIGMVLGAEILQEPITKKYRCWLYTLEYNTLTSSGTDPKIINNPEEFVRQNLAKPGVNYYMQTELSKDPKYILRKPNGTEDPQYRDRGKDERSGGKLAFRLRLFGGTGDVDPIRTSIANTENLSGGAWAPNGLTQANEYLSIGNWKENKKVFEA